MVDAPYIMSQNLKESAAEFIKSKLSYVDDFYDICYGSDGECGSDDFVEEKINAATIDMDAEWGKFGCSKAVFAFEEYPNFVFKIPFEGCFCCSWDDDDEPYWDEIRYYHYAGDENFNEWDYCETEARIYKRAVESKLDSFFAGTEFLCSYFGHPIYISERIVEGEGVDKNKFSNEILQKSRDMAENFGWVLYEQYIAAFIEDGYYEGEINRLLEFLKKNKIGDFHNGNVISDIDGHLYLVDYSDFGD